MCPILSKLIVKGPDIFTKVAVIRTILFLSVPASLSTDFELLVRELRARDDVSSYLCGVRYQSSWTTPQLDHCNLPSSATHASPYSMNKRMLLCQQSLYFCSYNPRKLNGKR